MMQVRDKIFAVGLVLALAMSTGVAGVAAAPTEGPSQLTGTYKFVTADRIGPAYSGAPAADRHVLVVGTSAYTLQLPKNAHPRSGARIKVSGRLQGRTFAAQSVQQTTAAPAADTTGVTRVLVILAYWTAPDATTRESAAFQMFSDTSNWYTQTTYGQLTQTGDVTPWLPIAGPENNLCFGDSYNILNQAESAAASVGYDAATYDRTVVYFPYDDAEGSDCGGFAGWAELPGNHIWLNGFMDRRVTTHEQGHNYGLYHANTLTCTDAAGTFVVLDTPERCLSTEYGDDFDTMGASNLSGQFSALQKDRLGLLGGRKVALTRGASARLTPFHTDSTRAAAYVTAPNGRVYWFEYRQPIGPDVNLPSGATNGLLVHMDDASYTVQPELLDMTPATAAQFGDATLTSGASWTTPEGYTFDVTTVDPTGATITFRSPQTQRLIDCLRAAFHGPRRDIIKKVFRCIKQAVRRHHRR